MLIRILGSSISKLKVDLCMEYKKNWILVEASTSEATTPIHIRDTRQMSSITLKDERSLQANKISDKVRRNITAAHQKGYHEHTTHEGTRVLDERFHSINGEETQTLNDRFTSYSPFDHINALVPHQNIHGEVEAIFERRLPIVSNKDEYFKNFPQLLMEQSTKSPMTEKSSNDRGQHLNSSHDNYQRKTLQNILLKNQGETDRHYRRTDSLNSAGLPTQIHYITSISPRWDVSSISTENLVKYYGKRPPTLLRRTPQFYDKCDLCAFKIFRPGDFCSACNRGASPLHPLDMPPNTAPSAYYLDQILSSRALETVPRTSFEWNDIGKIYSTGFYPTSSFHHFPSLASIRPIKSPVYRYGSSMPEALYDYEVWAQKQDRRTLQKRAIALAMALFAIALVVSAGVVLAAINI